MCEQSNVSATLCPPVEASLTTGRDTAAAKFRAGEHPKHTASMWEHRAVSMRLGGSQGGSDLLNPPPWHRGSWAGRVGRQQEEQKNKEKKKKATVNGVERFLKEPRLSH